MKKVMFLVLCAVIVAGVGFGYGCKKKTVADKAADAVNNAAKDTSNAVDDLTK